MQIINVRQIQLLHSLDGVWRQTQGPICETRTGCREFCCCLKLCNVHFKGCQDHLAQPETTDNPVLCLRFTPLIPSGTHQLAMLFVFYERNLPSHCTCTIMTFSFNIQLPLPGRRGTLDLLLTGGGGGVSLGACYCRQPGTSLTWHQSELSFNNSSTS